MTLLCRLYVMSCEQIPTESSGSVSSAGAVLPSKIFTDAGSIGRERRIERATRMLRAAPTQRASFIIGDESDGLIPATVVIRTTKGLVTGDLAIPRGRWDPWLFLKFLREQNDRCAS